MKLKLDVLNIGFSSSTNNCILNIFLSFFYGWNPICVTKIVIPAQVNLCHMSCNTACHAVGLSLQSGQSWVDNDTIEYNTANESHSIDFFFWGSSHSIDWAWVLLSDGPFKQREMYCHNYCTRLCASYKCILRNVEGLYYGVEKYHNMTDGWCQ